MKYISILVLTISITFCSYDKSCCQPKGVQVGAMCPDVLIPRIINFKTDHAKISDFKGKLLILDFWATWCAPCVSMFPITDSLQKQFEGKIQILSITDQDPETVTTFLKNIQLYKNITMPSVTGDRELKFLFPHVEIPHYVWIDKDGKVLAITGAEQLTADVINNFINKKETVLPVKADKFKTIDDSAPMFVTGNELIEGNNTRFDKVKNSNLIYHSIFTNYIDGFGCEQTSDSERITCKNSAIGDLYRVAAGRYKLINLQLNSTIWESRNPELIMFTDSASTANAKNRSLIDNWMSHYTFCYEIRFPKILNDKKFDLMLQELNNFFGWRYNITGGMERRKTKCLALIETFKIKKTDPVATKFNYSIDEYHLKIKNASTRQLLDLLSINLDTMPPLVDETHSNEKLDIELNCNMSDVKAINAALGAYGLQLVEKIAERDMIVIKDKVTSW